MRNAFFLIAITAALAGCASWFAPRAVNIEFDKDAYRLGAGDRVRIEVYGEGDLSVEATLEGSGLINYPLLGRFEAKGYTVPELERRLEHLLSQGYLVKPRVRIGIVSYRPIYIYGQVARTGTYPYIEGLTIEKAMVLAGGLTAIGSYRNIFIVREGSPPDRRERTELDTTVFPGDTIFVEESIF